MNKQIEISGKKIFYRVYGNGKPVLLVHGFGETGDIWKNQIAYLESDFQLIVPDLPGSGESEMVDDMSMDGMAEVLKIILDTETPPQTPRLEGLRIAQSQLLEDFNREENLQLSESSEVSPPVGGGDLQGALTLIGHSMGGYIALAFANKYAGYLSALGLFHSSAFADSEEKKDTRKKGIEFIRQHGAFEFLKNSTPNLFSPLSKDERPELIDGFIRSLSNFSAASLVNYYVAMMQRPDRTDLLKAIQLPVLFVMGEYDNAVPLQDGLKQAHMPEKSYIHILHQSGHMGMLEEPDNSNHILKQFLSET
ncbi:MAG: alpha/beta hydrolase [Chitinophagaceae bacterium]